MSRIMCLMSTVVALGLLSAGCERKAGPTSSEKTQAAATEDNHDNHDHAVGDGHDHEDHAGHDHGEDGHAHGGEALELGTRELGAYAVSVVQFGPAADGATELVFEIDVDGTPPPDAVRALVRNREGADSLKIRASKAGERSYDAHVGELPGHLDEGGTLLVEIEAASVVDSAEFEIKHE